MNVEILKYLACLNIIKQLLFVAIRILLKPVFEMKVQSGFSE